MSQPASAPAPGRAVWVLADPRAGTAAQPLGIAERLGTPFRTLALAWGPAARLPWPWPTPAGLDDAARAALRAALAEDGPPRLVLSAGRRSAPVARWLMGRGARAVHCMRPGPGWPAPDLLVIGRHDAPPADDPRVLPVLGACHRLSPAALAAARGRWRAFADLPRPRVALLAGGPVRGEGMAPALAADLAARVRGFAGSVLATASRRTGAPATEALAAGLAGIHHVLRRWGEAGENPYAGLLAWADAVVVTADSVSMLSEALATDAPVFAAGPDPAGRHAALLDSLRAAGLVRGLGAAPAPWPRARLDESGRVAAAIARLGWAA